MGIPPSYNSALKFLKVGITLALCGLTVLARAEDMSPQQTPGAPYNTPVSKLQVTGNMEKFSVDADHADVQSVLKAIFSQAHAQFTTDNSVVGQVTLSLSGQSLPTTLDAVCKQLLLRYQKNANGIYVFDQDALAVKVAIVRLQDQNALLRQQLRYFGLNLPDDKVLDTLQFGTPGGAAPTGVNGPGGNSSGAPGGFGGAGRTNAKSNLAPGPQGGRGGGQPLPDSQRRGAALGNNVNADSVAKEDSGRPTYDYLTKEYLEEIFALKPQTNSLQNPDGYRAYMKQSGLVWINTGDQRAPVTEILQELSRQSNTPILIDPSIPSGSKFTMQGFVTPRTLPEALQVLAQATHLAWRWVGTHIMVSALPDFQIFYNSNSPQVIYGSTPLQSQQNGVLGQSRAQIQQPGNNSNGGYAAPRQTPLPITNGPAANGEKKTP
ncbi:MAG: hypothetical protein JWN14_3677 [Chthonomonadales bacterium]|nr:hypothetical protein [Chthonomonadales bacterium]